MLEKNKHSFSDITLNKLQKLSLRLQYTFRGVSRASDVALAV